MSKTPCALELGSPASARPVIVSQWLILREDNPPPPVNFSPLTGCTARNSRAIGVLLKRRTPGAAELARRPRRFNGCRGLSTLPLIDFSGHHWQSIAGRFP